VRLRGRGSHYYSMTLRVLLVESDADDVLFLQEVLTEIEGGRYWSNWIRIETLHADTWAKAGAILANEPLDLLLLDLNLADTQGAETFRRAQATAWQVPVILLTCAEDAEVAARLVRDGAQDFLIKKQIDCAPMAHAMRNAIERHRLLSATRAASMIDSLTGLLNRGGFLTFADRDRKLAERLGRRLMVLVAEPKNLAAITATYRDQRRDLALIEAADHLRGLAGPADLLARITETRFALAIFDTDVEPVEAAWARFHSAAVADRIGIGAAIFEASRPASLEVLIDQAESDLSPAATAVRR
jgi:PleD family two-component response regulator